MTEQFKIGDEVVSRGIVTGFTEHCGCPLIITETKDGKTLYIAKEHLELGQPEKVKIPQFVADYIEDRQKDKWWLFSAIADRENQRLREWLVMCDMDIRIKRQELYARAWLDGYEVEKEPLYQIPLKGLMTTDGEQQYLTGKHGQYFASRKHTELKQTFTQSELDNNVPKYYRQFAKEVADDTKI